MSEATHRVIDGSTVTLSGPMDLSQSPSSFLVAAGQEFASGPATWGREIASLLDIDDFSELVSFQGGTLSIGGTMQTNLQTGGQYVFHLAVWEGEGNCVKTPCYDMATADIVGAFAQFTITEDKVGLTLTPRDPAKTPVVRTARRAPDVVKTVPGVGRVQVRALTDDVRSLLPDWPGIPVDGGDLYYDDQEAEGSASSLVLVGSSSVAWIAIAQDAAESAALESISHLQIEWTEAAA